MSTKKIAHRVSRKVSYPLCVFGDYLESFFTFFSKSYFSPEIQKLYEALRQQVNQERGSLDCDYWTGECVVETGVFYKKSDE